MKISTNATNLAEIEVAEQENAGGGNFWGSPTGPSSPSGWPFGAIGGAKSVF
jgi:hypothetical protein